MQGNGRKMKSPKQSLIGGFRVSHTRNGLTTDISNNASILINISIASTYFCLNDCLHRMVRENSAVFVLSPFPPRNCISLRKNIKI